VSRCRTAPQHVARLRGVSVEITRLSAGYLGTTAIGGSIMYLSDDAAGYGWSIGTSSWTHAALDWSVAPTEFLADASTVLAGHEDLLTVVMHELGHTLGLADLNPIKAPANLMAETLATGVRRLPYAADVAKIVAAQDVSRPAATKHVPTGSALDYALFEAAGEAAIGVLPAPTVARAIQVGRGGAVEGTYSRPRTQKENQETGSHAMAFVVTYLPEAPTDGASRISHEALRLKPTAKVHV
jgi:hypothetical protein